VPKRKSERTGLLIFRTFLFEGTENIKRGEWFKIVTGNGEQITPTPPKIRTYYYEVFPSNLELGLWMELKECYIRINQLVLTPKMRLKKKKRLRFTTPMDKSFLKGKKKT
jgi:hypothetical protein